MSDPTDTLPVSMDLGEDYPEIRESVRRICADFPGSYWRELDEAAWVDGASRLYTLRRVILPLAMPGIVVVSIMTFIGAYAQQFIFALTFNSKTEFMPLPVGLFAFFGKQEVIWNELMAASFVGILPVMIVIVFLQRYLVAGLTAGAVKQ